MTVAVGRPFPNFHWQSFSFDTLSTIFLIFNFFECKAHHIDEKPHTYLCLKSSNNSCKQFIQLLVLEEAKRVSLTVSHSSIKSSSVISSEKSKSLIFYLNPLMSLYSDCHPVLLIRYKLLSSEGGEGSEPNLQHSSCRDSKK